MRTDDLGEVLDWIADLCNEILTDPDLKYDYEATCYVEDWNPSHYTENDHIYAKAMVTMLKIDCIGSKNSA